MDHKRAFIIHGWTGRHDQEFIAIFSDNDELVPLAVNQKIYQEKLGAQIIVEHNKGHFMEQMGGVTEIPLILEYL